MPIVKVLYIIDQLDIGGAEKQLLELVKRLDRNKFSPVICSVWNKMELADSFRSHGVEILPIHKRSRWDFLFLFKLAQYIRQNSIRIVQTILPTANAWGRVAAVLAGSPILIASERAVRTQEFDSVIHNRADRLLAPFTDSHIVNSHTGAAHWEKLLHKKAGTCNVIHNGVDLSPFSRPTKAEEKNILRGSLAIGMAGPLVGTVARLNPEKDPATFLKAAQRVIAVHPEVRFIWIGDGRLRSDVETLSCSLGLQDNVRFIGERQDVPRLLELLDVFVLSSTWEGLPNAVIEAMACGKPVVATDVGGTHELIENGHTGFLVSPHQPDAIAEKIIQLLDDPALAQQVGLAGRAFIQQNFAMERMVSATQDLYLRLIHEKGLTI